MIRWMLPLALLVALLPFGCSREVQHGQIPQIDEPVGWVTCRADSVRLLAVNGEPVDDYDNGRPGSPVIVRTREGGFTVALAPGRHTLKCELAQVNPHAGRVGAADRIVVGEPAWLVVDIVENVEMIIEPRQTDQWRLLVRERRQRDAPQSSVGEPNE